MKKKTAALLGTAALGTTLGLLAYAVSSPARVANTFANLMDKNDRKRLATMSPPPGITKVTDIAYIDDGNPYHLLDVYYPEGTAEPLPALIDIHGGGLIYGDKELNRYYGMYLAGLGYTVVMPSYPLAPPALFEEQVRDCIAVYRWAAEHAADYFMDMDNFFVTGDSAGAHLAAYTALVQLTPELQALYNVEPAPVTIRALGLVSGMFETKTGAIKHLRELFYGKDYENSEIYKNMDYVRVPGLEALPPCYLVTSAEDGLHTATLEFAAILQKRGVEYELLDWPKLPGGKLPHVFSILFPTQEESVVTSAEMTGFFQKHSTQRIEN